MKTLIVTSRLSFGPPDSEVAQTADALLDTLLEHGDDVSIGLATSRPLFPEDRRKTRNYRNVPIINVFDEPPDYQTFLYFPFIRISEQVTGLISRGFELVYFVGPGAPGFDFLRRRRFGTVDRAVTCVSVIVSPTEWFLFRQGRYFRDPTEDMSLFFAERYSAAHSDYCVIPDEKAAEFLSQRSWDPAGETSLHGSIADTRAWTVLHERFSSRGGVRHGSGKGREDSDTDGPGGGADGHADGAGGRADGAGGRADDPGRHANDTAGRADCGLVHGLTSRVDVCIPYYNHGKYLEEALQSIERQTFRNYEVFVVDDGSDDPFSIDVFRAMKRKYSKLPNWHFLSQRNLGQGLARNKAAFSGNSEFIVFFDADNIAVPDMLERYVKAAIASGDDCLTCYKYIFSPTRHPSVTLKSLDRKVDPPQALYVPIGNLPALGLFLNCFGDTNFIIKRAVFQSTGGFGEDVIYGHSAGLTDHEFLARLCMTGHSLDVVPECLFLYRRHRNSVTWSSNKFYNMQRVLATYSRCLSSVNLEVLAPWVHPLYFMSLPEGKGNEAVTAHGSGNPATDAHPVLSALARNLTPLTRKLLREDSFITRFLVFCLDALGNLLGQGFIRVFTRLPSKISDKWKWCFSDHCFEGEFSCIDDQINDGEIRFSGWVQSPMTSVESVNVLSSDRLAANMTPERTADGRYVFRGRVEKTPDTLHSKRWKIRVVGVEGHKRDFHCKMAKDNVAHSPPVLATACSRDYAPPLTAMLFSVLDKLSHDCRAPRIYVFTDSVDRHFRKLVRDSLSASGKNFRLDFIDVNVDEFKNLRVTDDIAETTCFRLKLPERLPDEQKVIYLDPDMIVLDDINRLWNAGLSEDLVLAVPFRKMKTGFPHFSDFGLSPDDDYFNAGVLVVDLEKWRIHEIGSRCIDFARRYKPRCFEQDALNVVLAGRWGSLDYRWNVPSALFPVSDQEQRRLIEPFFTDLRKGFILQDPAALSTLRMEAGIVHFSTPAKPWTPSLPHPHRSLYESYLSRTLFAKS